MSQSAADAFPDGVPLTVPDSWKRATLGAPVPVIRCTYIFPDTHHKPGQQCGRWSLRGTNVCIKHGGNLPSVRLHAEATVEAAKLRLIGSTDMAVDGVLDLAQNSTSDAVRLKANLEILDRAGVRGGVEVDVQVEDRRDPSDVLRERIQTLRARTIEGEVIRREADAAIAALDGDTVAGDEPDTVPAPPEDLP